MTTAVLVITLVTGGFTIAQNISQTVRAIRAVHHHTTRPLYRHVFKPIGKEIKKCN